MKNKKILSYIFGTMMLLIDVKIEDKTIWLSQKTNGRIVFDIKDKYYWTYKKLY